MSPVPPRRRYEGMDFVLGIEAGGESISVGLIAIDRGVDADGEAVGPVVESVAGRSARARSLPAVLLDEQVSRRENPREESLLGTIDAVLTRHGLVVGELALIGVGRGPGSFTGIRVGLSVALGLGLGGDVPTWPVCSLAALALNGGAAGSPVLALIDARKGEVYGGLYRLGNGLPEVLLAPRLGTCEAVTAQASSALAGLLGVGATPVVLGSGAVAHDIASPLPPVAHLSSGSMVAWLAALEWRGAGWDASRAPALDAVYLRRPEAEIALQGVEGG